MKKPDVVQKAINSIGKRIHPAVEAEKKLAKMSEVDKLVRAEETKNAKIRPEDLESR